MEDFIGKPFTYTVDVENISQVVSAVKEIKAMKVYKSLFTVFISFCSNALSPLQLSSSSEERRYCLCKN